LVNFGLRTTVFYVKRKSNVSLFQNRLAVQTSTYVTS
jgi:hypothetical protein